MMHGNNNLPNIPSINNKIKRSGVRASTRTEVLYCKIRIGSFQQPKRTVVPVGLANLGYHGVVRMSKVMVKAVLAASQM